MPRWPAWRTGLAYRMSRLADDFHRRDAEFRDWVGGITTAGPFGDGRYPLADAAGTVHYIKCPIKCPAAWS